VGTSPRAPVVEARDLSVHEAVALEEGRDVCARRSRQVARVAREHRGDDARILVRQSGAGPFVAGDEREDERP
jgi:hypothetical protein